MLRVDFAPQLDSFLLCRRSDCVEDVRNHFAKINPLETRNPRPRLDSRKVEHDVKLIDVDSLNGEEWKTIDDFFEAQVFPVLTPLAVDPSHPFPYISNLSLSLAVQLRDPESGSVEFARVKVPRSLPRWVPTGVKHHFVPLERVIAANLSALFPGMDIVSSNVFRVTRYSDLELTHSEEPEDLMALIEEQVFRRRFAEVVRVEIETGTSEELKELLLEELKEDQSDDMPALPEIEAVETGPLVGLGDLMALAMLDVPELRDQPFMPRS